jgi:lipoate---protein ligase
MTPTATAGDETLSITPYNRDDELLAATRADGRDRVSVIRPPSTAVVLGRSSRPSVELHTEPCLADGVALHRRRGGGCSVVLDPGNVVVVAAITAPGLQLADYFAQLSAWLIGGLAQAGVQDVTRRDVSDLCLGHRKIGGACMFRARGLLLYSVSLLVEPDLRLMDRYLRHPPREPAYRRGRTHRDFVTTIHQHAQITAQQLAASLQALLDPPQL